MIREARVKEEYRLALAEQKHGEDLSKMDSYFKGDYYVRELLLSFIGGTICYLVLVILWVLANMSSLLDQINSLDYIGMGVSCAMYYLAFMVAYLFLTLLVYAYRYHRMHRISQYFASHLKKLNKMYAREEKLKL